MSSWLFCGASWFLYNGDSKNQKRTGLFIAQHAFQGFPHLAILSHVLFLTLVSLMTGYVWVHGKVRLAPAAVSSTSTKPPRRQYVAQLYAALSPWELLFVDTYTIDHPL